MVLLNHLVQVVSIQIGWRWGNSGQNFCDTSRGTRSPLATLPAKSKTAAKISNHCFILTSFCPILRKLFKYFRKFPLFLKIPTFFLPKLKKRVKFRPQLLFPTNVGTLLIWLLEVDHTFVLYFLAPLSLYYRIPSKNRQKKGWT